MTTLDDDITPVYEGEAPAPAGYVRSDRRSVTARCIADFSSGSMTVSIDDKLVAIGDEAGQYVNNGGWVLGA